MNKNSTTIILIIIIIAAIVATVLINKKDVEPVKTEPITASDIQINEAIEADSTVSINAALNKINVDDTSDKELSELDAELNNF